jgi:hypothetical protein
MILYVNHATTKTTIRTRKVDISTRTKRRDSQTANRRSSCNDEAGGQDSTDTAKALKKARVSGKRRKKGLIELSVVNGGQKWFPSVEGLLDGNIVGGMIRRQ